MENDTHHELSGGRCHHACVSKRIAAAAAQRRLTLAAAIHSRALRCGHPTRRGTRASHELCRLSGHALPESRLHILLPRYDPRHVPRPVLATALAVRARVC